MPGADLPVPPPLTGRLLLGRALRLRCPVCGNGGVFHRWVVMADRCPTCGFRFERIEGHWLGSLTMNMILTLGLGLSTMVLTYVLTLPDPSIPLMLTGVLTVALVAPVVLFPWTRLVWTSVDLMMRPLDPDDDVAPDHLPSGGPPG